MNVTMTWWLLLLLSVTITCPAYASSNCDDLANGITTYDNITRSNIQALKKRIVGKACLNAIDARYALVYNAHIIENINVLNRLYKTATVHHCTFSKEIIPPVPITPASCNVVSAPSPPKPSPPKPKPPSPFPPKPPLPSPPKPSPPPLPPATSYATGGTPISITAADFNGDDIIDLAIANSFNNSVSVLLGNGDGTFVFQVAYATGDNPTSVTAADFNGDDHTDLVTANPVDNTVSVLLNNGNGTFAPQVAYVTSDDPQSVTAADFNGDGKLDLVTANYADSTVSILFGYGNGKFN